jgi:thiol-disulfide isomerase/thioredoxin
MNSGFSKIVIAIFSVVIIAIALAAGSWYAKMSGGGEFLSKQNESGMKKVVESGQQANTTEEHGSEEKESEAQRKAEKTEWMKEQTGGVVEAAPVSESAYQDYSPDKPAKLASSGYKVVLFFHAPWCPFCRSANSTFVSRTSEIPQGVAVLKTDYDSNSDLKKKYGVTYQHTFVQIDAEGNAVSKWSGGDIDNLKKYIK